MTRIDPNRTPAQTDAADRSPAFGNARRHDRDGGLDRRRAGTGSLGTNDAFQARDHFGENREREAAFSERMRHAIETERDRDGTADSDPATLRLLASVERPVGLPSPASNAGVGSTAPVEGSAAARVEVIAERAEALIRSVERPAPGQSLSLRFNASDIGAEGLAGITVTMSTDSLDVTLVRCTGEASQAFLQSAQALAERLQQRFSRRLVRIFEVDAPAGAGMEAEARPDALGALSALLSTATRR